MLQTVQSRAGGGQEQALYWAGVVGARNAEQQKLIGQVQTAQAREAGLAEKLSGAQQARQSLEVRMQANSDAQMLLWNLHMNPLSFALPIDHRTASLLPLKPLVSASDLGGVVSL